MRNPEKTKAARCQSDGASGMSIAADKELNPSANQPTRQQRWQQANPLKRWSHIATASAIRRGILTRPDRCDCCGKVGPVDAHHDDHTNPLKVRWLARACHARHHAKARKADG